MTPLSLHTYSEYVAMTRDRRSALQSLLQERHCSSQEELLLALAERGVQTTQPVLSRDLRALHAAKRDGVYTLLERVTPLEHLRSLVRTEEPMHLVVLRQHADGTEALLSSSFCWRPSCCASCASCASCCPASCPRRQRTKKEALSSTEKPLRSLSIASSFKYTP